MNEVDLLNVWWARAGIAGVLAVVLYFLVKWVGRRMTNQEMRLQNQIAERAAEDKAERVRKAEEDRKERDALTRRLREIEESRYNEMKSHTSIVVKALTDCAVSQQGNDRSRRRLDVTLREMIRVLQNIPCNRVAASPEAARSFTTPSPEEDTPASGLEATDEIHPSNLDPSHDERVRADLERRSGGGPNSR